MGAVALLATLLLGAAPAAAREYPRHTYRDPVHKFSLKIFSDWKQVPLQADEKHHVAKFMPERSPRMITPEILVVRVNTREGGDSPVVTGDGEIPPWMRARMPQSAWDAVFARLMLPEDAKPDRDDPDDDVESDDDVEGKLWRFEYAMGSGRDATYFFTYAEFAKDGIEYGIFMQCSEIDRRKFERGFKMVAESFQFFDEDAEEVETLDILEDVAISPARRRDIERSMVHGWDIIISPKKNYIVVYNTDNNRNKLLAREIARRIEMIREQVYEEQFPPAQPITAVSVVRVCKDRQEYHAYGGPGGSAGYWNSGSEELVFYDASPSRKIDDDTVAVLYHEAFHQYIFYSVGNVAPHSWFNEGHGDYYAGAELRGRSFRIEPFDWRRQVIKTAVVQGRRERTEQTDLESGETVVRWGGEGYTPLEDFVHFTQREYYSYPSVCYAQGWSLIYFLREIVPTKRSYREKWGHILDTYFDTLKAEVNAEPQGVGPIPDGDEDDPSADEDEEGEEGDDDADGPITPGEPGEDEGEEPEPEDPSNFLPAMPRGGFGGRAALEKAVKKAFEGVDFEELEEAWADAVKRDM